MKKVVGFLDRVIRELGEEYTFKNYIGEDIPCSDYLDFKYVSDGAEAGKVDLVDFERVCYDRNRCVEIIENFFNEVKDNTQRELVLAMYCNFCVKYGITGRFQKEKKEDLYDGLEKLFEGLGQDEKYLADVYIGVKNQKYFVWDKVLEINKNSIVAKIYKFVKLCNEYGVEVIENGRSVKEYDSMWELYETLPEEWQDYVMGIESKVSLIKLSDNPSDCDNLLPYINFTPFKEIVTEALTAWFGAFLEKLGIHKDSKNLYEEIVEKIGLGQLQKLVVDYFPDEMRSLPDNKVNDISIWSKWVRLFLESNYKLVERIDDTALGMRVIVEKLQALCFGDEDALELIRWVKSDNILEKYDFKDMYIGLRNLYLHIPVSVGIKRDLFLSHYNAFKKERIIKKYAKQREEMMDYYAHSWKHISYPQIVKEIAEELGPSNRAMANRLMKAYNSERTLQRGIQLLQYISSGDEKRVSIEFKNGVAKSGVSTDKTVTLKKVINESLDLVLFKILMVESDDSNRIKKCREKLAQKNLDKLRDEYTEHFLGGVGEDDKIICWFNDNFISAELEINDNWDSVRFKEDSFAVNQFKEILVEIFTNVLLHGKERMSISFSSNESEMTICEKNVCSDLYTGSQSGISTMHRVLDYINYGSEISSSVETVVDDLFEITVRFNKSLLIRKGR